MSNWRALRSKSVWRIGLAGIAPTVPSSYLWSQEDSRLQQAPSGISQPFAGFDASLAKAADTRCNRVERLLPSFRPEPQPTP
jgi:hypothetical protein